MGGYRRKGRWLIPTHSLILHLFRQKKKKNPSSDSHPTTASSTTTVLVRTLFFAPYCSTMLPSHESCVTANIKMRRRRLPLLGSFFSRVTTQENPEKTWAQKEMMFPTKQCQKALSVHHPLIVFVFRLLRKCNSKNSKAKKRRFLTLPIPPLDSLRSLQGCLFPFFLLCANPLSSFHIGEGCNSNNIAHVSLRQPPPPSTVRGREEEREATKITGFGCRGRGIYCPVPLLRAVSGSISRAAIIL